MNSNGRREDANSTSSSSLDSRFNQTLRNFQGLLKGRTFPGKVLLSRRSDPLDSANPVTTPVGDKSYSDDDIPSEFSDKSEEEVQSTSMSNNNAAMNKLKPSNSNTESASKVVHKPSIGARATDSARVMKFKKELSAPTVILETIRALAWSGVPPYMRPTVWRLLLGYAPPNSDRREVVLRRKRLEYLECVAQYYDIPDSERSDDEINMLRQISVDCPRTVPDVAFFQQSQIQKSLERILYTWLELEPFPTLSMVHVMFACCYAPDEGGHEALEDYVLTFCHMRFTRDSVAIRHPASGYVQGINDLVTPFLVVFLSEYLEGGVGIWSVSDLTTENITNVEADCYWCLSKLLDGMQDHYTFSQPGIQRLVFKLKELVRRIDEPVSKHIEDQGLEFLQFAFRWFNCLLIREIPFCLVTRLWDTYLAEGDALPDFLVYIFASFLLTWSDKLLKLDFQEMVMFLQHLPTNNWTHQELEMVLSRAYMWHTMFDNCPSHLAS